MSTEPAREADTDSADGEESEQRAEPSGDLSQPRRSRVNARSRSRYTEEEIERGLAAVAMCSGNTRRAAKELARQGLKVPRPTLRLWATDTYLDRYLDIQRETLPYIYARIAERNEDLAHHLTDLEEVAAKRLKETLPELRPGEVSTALRNVSVSKGIATDKAAVIRGRPTEIRADRSAEDLIRALVTKFSGVVKVQNAELVESEARELEDPETGS